MKQQQAGVPVSRIPKKKVLHAVYRVYSRWVESFPLACHMGCSACCTRSVTMTSLEGEMILDFVKGKGGEKWLREKLALVVPEQSRPGISTNMFAEACLNHRELDGETFGCWDFAPCVFLEEQICTIYEARPFGCRSFGSLAQCAADREAEMAPIHLAVNTVFTQVIEHIDSDGGYWSTMTDILHSLADSESRHLKKLLQPARPVPGFLLEPREAKVVQVLLQQLSEGFSEKVIFGDLIDNFMPI